MMLVTITQQRGCPGRARPPRVNVQVLHSGHSYVALKNGWGTSLQQECSVHGSLSGFPVLASSSPGGQMVKNLPAMLETHVQSLGQEDAPEESTATHSSILAWRIPWTEEPEGLQSTGSQSDRLSDKHSLSRMLCLHLLSFPTH